MASFSETIKILKKYLFGAQLKLKNVAFHRYFAHNFYLLLFDKARACSFVSKSIKNILLNQYSSQDRVAVQEYGMAGLEVKIVASNYMSSNTPSQLTN